VIDISAAKESEEIFQEYHDYADLKARILDEAFIEQFNENTVLWMARKYGWIASTTDMTPPSPVSATSFDLGYST
jgi:tyrosine-protein phosphatase SIW14